MSTTLRPFVIALGIVTATGLAVAQTPAPAPGPKTAAAAEAAPAVALPSPPADFAYSIEGRRDPFVSVLKRGAGPGVSPGKRAEGAAGLQTSEIAVRGIVLNRGAWAALVAGPDGKVFTVRAGDHLLDGTVRNVTAQYVAVLQEVKDPLSFETQREVRKYLRGGEEVK
jgi:Tfp pilus assembly protein PilP